ncbi:winged helix-turn-helix transcriptional regulator [Ruminiclostridium cellobioparum]|uniref:Uncharacterized protein n=1 Tax=Ruminiclostridium cellobioparum subsp. termitidis CT1112 TaxID=1195236 RepID=S0FGR6_RUMCE|nr:winged helix-turn-helix transcriptional regulator [Ruminiclostridium cellobioparum]EMS70377.1 hypothetical protein CTER_3940 [Ruminiclostridium cellobioparum subsp. termitidis CT1112]
MDKKHIVLNEIRKNPKITQRELSKILQCSLGSINLLLSKMVNEGLIKIKRMPMNRIRYILTPNGVLEKLQKTSKYIKSNYNFIINIQETIRMTLEDLTNEYGDITVVLEDDEISELVKLSIGENDKVNLIRHGETIGEFKTVVALDINTYNVLKSKYKRVVNLIELI